VEGQRPILAPMHRKLEGHSPSMLYSLFQPCPRQTWQETRRVMDAMICTGLRTSTALLSPERRRALTRFSKSEHEFFCIAALKNWLSYWARATSTTLDFSAVVKVRGLGGSDPCYDLSPLQ